jgi:hypothetical protein
MNGTGNPFQRNGKGRLISSATAFALAAITIIVVGYASAFTMGFQNATRDQPFGREQIGALEFADNTAVPIGTANLKWTILKTSRCQVYAQPIERALAQERLRPSNQKDWRGGTIASAQKRERILNRHRALPRRSIRERAPISSAA